MRGYLLMSGEFFSHQGASARLQFPIAIQKVKMNRLPADFYAQLEWGKRCSIESKEVIKNTLLVAYHFMKK